MIGRMNTLLRANAGRGAGFQMLAADEPVLMVYDVIVASDADAAWLGGVSAETFVRTLRGLTAPRVHVRVNSPGGDAFAGIAMANAVADYPGEVVVHVDGIAASAASFLLAVTDAVNMGRASMVMVHKAWTLAIGNADDMMRSAAVLEKLDAQQAALFAAKVPDQDWPAMLAAETWMTAEEAVSIGLASAVAGDAPAQARACKFDLSAFERAPEQQPEPDPAPEPVVAQGDVERRRRLARVAALKG